MAYSATTLSLNPSASFNFIKTITPKLLMKSYLAPNFSTNTLNAEKILRYGRLHRNPFLLQCTNPSALASASETETDYETEEVDSSTEDYSDEEEGSPPNGQTSPLKRRRRRYRKQYPGEAIGITEEMRFVAMKLRNDGKPKSRRRASAVGRESGGGEDLEFETEKEGKSAKTWQPSIEGFIKYLVDSKLVFSTVERIVDESTDVSCE